MLKIENISKEYKVGKIKSEVLKEISLNFKAKEFVSILGPSGCGKTTLLNILGGLDVPTTGDLYINDINIKEYSNKQLDYYRNSVLGFIFQNSILIKNLTVKENVEIALELSGIKAKERKARVLEVLKKLNISHLLRKKAKYLSGGEQQRVAIARAIVNNPKIILADEPTGALDSKNAMEVMKILQDLSKDYLVIMVTHNEELANLYSSRIIKMKDGIIISDRENNMIDNDEKITIKIYENNILEYEYTDYSLLFINRTFYINGINQIHYSKQIKIIVNYEKDGIEDSICKFIYFTPSFKTYKVKEKEKAVE